MCDKCNRIEELLSSAKNGSAEIFDKMKKKDIMKYAKASDILDALKLNQLMGKKEEEKKTHPVVVTLAIIGAVAAVAAIAYGVYCYFTPDYMDDFEDDYNDDFDDDYFEDEEDESK